MMRLAQPRLGDGATATALMSLAMLDLGTSEGYHRVGEQGHVLVFLPMLWLLSMAVLSLVGRWTRARQPCGRLVVVAATALFMHWMVPGPLHRASLVHAAWQVLEAAALGIVAAWLVFKAPNPAWRRIRLALVVAASGFTLTPFLLAWWLAPSLAWLPDQDTSPATIDSQRTLDLYVLLDELNARSASPVVEAITRQGLDASMRPIASVGESTAQSVPAMFSPRRFPQSRPCGLTAICSSEAVLDFSRVTAGRNDIDVVGFYHPYCAMRGLRSCNVSTVELPIFDAVRWRCALLKRAGRLGSQEERRCRHIASEPWERMVQDVISHAQRAPALIRGGVLFVHLPLPHPPALDGTGDMSIDYPANVRRAAAVVADLVGRAQSAKLSVRVEVFSDHPLRQAAWCRIYVDQGLTEPGCAPVAALADDRVPLILAGRDLGQANHILDNSGVFHLWRTR